MQNTDRKVKHQHKASNEALLVSKKRQLLRKG